MGTLALGLLLAAKAVASPGGGAIMDGAGSGGWVAPQPARAQPKPCHFILMAAAGERDRAYRPRRPAQAQQPCLRMMSL